MFTQGVLYSPDHVMGNISPYTAQRVEIAPVCGAGEQENIPLLCSISPVLLLLLSPSSLLPLCLFVYVCFWWAVDVGPYASFPLPKDYSRSPQPTQCYLSCWTICTRVSRFSSLQMICLGHDFIKLCRLWSTSTSGDLLASIHCIVERYPARIYR